MTERQTIIEFKDRVMELLGPKAFQKSALNIRDGAGVLEKVLGSGNYKTVLEIGTYRGIATAYMAQFCDVITLDLLNGQLERTDPEFDRRAFWQALDVTNIVSVLMGDPANKTDLLPHLKFDLAFIDGGKYDVESDFGLVRHCGAVLFHDYDYRRPPKTNYVYDFVNTLPKYQVQVMDIFALWTDTEKRR